MKVIFKAIAIAALAAAAFSRAILLTDRLSKPGRLPRALTLPLLFGLSAVWIGIGNMLVGTLAAWLVLINLAAFLAFGLDKWKAKRKEKKPSVRRVPERTLFLLALLGVI